MKIISFSPFGYEGELVTVEVDLRRGIPAVDLVGLADSAVKEARERMRAAIRNSGFDFPPERVLISLSPADVKKEGAGFDLAIALAVLDIQQKCKKSGYDGAAAEEDKSDSQVLIMGELELSGKIRPVRAINAAVSTAAANGVKHCIVPLANADEAGGLELMQVHGVDCLEDAFNVLQAISLDSCKEDIHSSQFKEQVSEKTAPVEFDRVECGEDLSEIVGQDFLVRGLQIAAAGFHNLIAYGPPGCGKSLALQRFPSLVPYLTKEEAQTVTRIYSLAGLMPAGQPLIRRAPFRMPHQSASLQGMIGGGMNCAPGEISLAHNGTLFLDEAAEFRSSVLQALRVPMESGCVTLCRAGRHTVYPANFQLLIATNPCPCGNYGSPDKICLCSTKSVEQYWKKFSGPLLDRIEIRVPVQRSDPEAKSEKHFSSQSLRIEIERAVRKQKERQGKYNSELTPEEIQLFCKLDDECRNYLNEASQKYGFSARAIHGIIKLARTIADMAGNEDIKAKDLLEAIDYRKNEGGLDIMF